MKSLMTGALTISKELNWIISFKQPTSIMKAGDKVKIIRMDDAGQVHLKGHGLALIPGIEEFEVIE